MKTWAIVRIALVATGVIQGALSDRVAAPADGVSIPLLFVVLGFGIFAMLFLVGVQRLNPRNAPAWRYPSWSLSPFSLRAPLQFFHLCGYFFLASGLGGALGQVVHGQPLGLATLFLPAFGAGLLVGVYLCTAVFRSKMVAS